MRQNAAGDYVLTLGGTDSLDDALKLLERKMEAASGTGSLSAHGLPANWESRYAVFLVGQLGREPEPGDVIRVPANPEAVFAEANLTSPKLARKARELFKTGQTLTSNRDRRKRAHAEKQALSRQGPGIATPVGSVGVGNGSGVQTRRPALSASRATSSVSRPADSKSQSTPQTGNDRTIDDPEVRQSKPRAPWVRPAELRAQTAFEKSQRLTETLTKAGIPPKAVARMLEQGITAEDALVLTNRLMQKRPTLDGFGPRMVTLAVLHHVMTQSGPESHPDAPRADIDALYDVMARFEGMVVLRPDGYLASLTRGKAIRKLGNVVSRPYGFGVGSYPVGVPYIAHQGLFYEINPDGSRGEKRGYVRSNLERGFAGRVVDGAENAVVDTVDGVITLLTDPGQVLQDAGDAIKSIPPAQEVARWLTESAPEFVERFNAMPPGDQVEAVSTVVSHLFTMGLLASPVLTGGKGLSKARVVPKLMLAAGAAGSLTVSFEWAAVTASTAGRLAALGKAGAAAGALGILHSTLPDPAAVNDSRAASSQHYGVPPKGEPRKPRLVRPNRQAERWVTAEEFLERHSGRLDLRAHEARGGHTLEKHVGKTDGELRARLKREPDTAQMSTFVSEIEARRAVQKAIRENALKIAEWEANSPTRKLELRTDFRGGRVLRRNQRSSHSAVSARVVLFSDGAGGWFVRTAYPE
ncbi:MAG: RNase A-like domain-containing protein [Myxococcota bacterium]